MTVLLFASLGPLRAESELDVEIRFVPEDDRYDVLIDGRLFTSYRYGSDFPDKPIFYPVMSPGGNAVNRQFPMVKAVEGESSDHAHHQSMWFTYGDVNGVDYWNPSKVSRRIAQRSANASGAELRITSDWTGEGSTLVLKEEKTVSFGGVADVFWMDHDITLTAGAEPVLLGDTKEGAFAIRVAGSLRERDRTGHYLNAEGLETSRQVWGRPSPWVALQGKVGESGREEEEVTVVIFSHPTTVNHPPYWHARDYGLFAANPFGRRAYDPNQPERVTVLQPGENVHMRFRLAVYTGLVGADRLSADYARFAR